MAPTMSGRATFTVAFRSEFGARAIEVARAQVAAAPAGEQRAVWQAILDDLIAMPSATGTNDTSVNEPDTIRDNTP